MWLAFQDGDGAWTRALPTTSNGNVVFQTTIASPRGGIATVFQAGSGLTSLQVLFGAPEELSIVGFTNPRFCGPAVVKALLGSVAGLDSAEFAIIRAGFFAEALAHPAAGGEFVLNVLPPGPQDILATRVVSTNGIDSIPHMILRRSVDLPDGATLPVLDFAAPEAFAPAVANVSLSGTQQHLWRRHRPGHWNDPAVRRSAGGATASG